MITKILKKIKIGNQELTSTSLDALEKEVDAVYEDSMSATHKKGYANLKRLINALKKSDKET